MVVIPVDGQHAEYEILCRDNPDLGSCPTCRERGTYRYRGVEQICNCQEQRQLHTQYLAGGIGLLYQRLDWDHFTGDPEVLKTLQSYVRRHEDYVDQGLGLLFTGERGIGKTMLATLVLGSTISRSLVHIWQPGLPGVAAYSRKPVPVM
ncbi:MAG TPA: hypothetical protein VES60_09630 [Nakamurella sp.]|nr:hypothetical protein [Nakamurella sp.]